MVNFGPLAAEIVSLVWGTSDNFNWFRVLAALLHGTLVPCSNAVYSEANFEVFRPAGATRCTDGGEIWHGGASMPNFTPIGATTRV